jgi:hypothetical protein
MNGRLIKCDFCTYRSNSGCMVTPNSYYCKNAVDEYYQYIRTNGSYQKPVKSLRSWDRK